MRKPKTKHFLTLLLIFLLTFSGTAYASESKQASPYSGNSNIAAFAAEDEYQYGYWMQSGSRWWFQFEDGSYAADGVWIIDDKTYGFDANGWMVTGWYYEPTFGWFYFDSDGSGHNGWLSYGGQWYYMVDGWMLYDAVYEIDGAIYGFAPDGCMITGWFYADEVGWFYFNSDGSAYNGWLYYCGCWYYLEDGYAYADDTYNINGANYRFTPDGAMVTGWYSDSYGRWYYYNTDGAAYHGWLSYNGSWYYIDNGFMYANGTYIIDGKSSRFDANGIWLGYETGNASFTQQVADLVNQERAKVGLSPLTFDAELSRAAQIRANEIKTKFSHTRPNGTSCFTVLDECGIDYWGCGENIAYGDTTPAAVMEGWMNSPGHKANILNPNYTKIGVGFDQNHWTQLFTY